VITVSASACINAPTLDVWEALARLEDIRLWSEAVIAHAVRAPRRGASARNARAICAAA
jgi:hypothetical protein